MDKLESPIHFPSQLPGAAPREEQPPAGGLGGGFDRLIHF